MSPDEKIDINDKRVPAMCGLVLVAVQTACDQGVAMTTEMLAESAAYALSSSEHSGPPFSRALFDAAVRRLVGEHLLVQLGAGVDERLVPGAQANT